VDPGHRRAFADESFQEAPAGGFYVLAAAVFTCDTDAREVLLSLRGKRAGKLHWNDMDLQEQQNAAKRLGELDAFHIVTVGSPVPRRRQERARAVCLRRLILELCEYGVQTLTLEGRTTQLNMRDTRTAVGARFDLPKNTAFRVEHVTGGTEPLLWAADIVAGAWRAGETGRAELRALVDHCVYETRVPTGC